MSNLVAACHTASVCVGDTQNLKFDFLQVVDYLGNNFLRLDT